VPDAIFDSMRRRLGLAQPPPLTSWQRLKVALKGVFAGVPPLASEKTGNSHEKRIKKEMEVS
jgi:hypothetical protein